MSNTLAPVWDMPILEGKLLKRQSGPFYPALQRDLDHLVGSGVVSISKLGYLLSEGNRWRLEGSYHLNKTLAAPILVALEQFESEQLLMSFIREMVYAISALSENDFDNAISADATFTDPVIAFGNVLDFGEWRKVNYTANAARQFGHLLPEGTNATLGEELHFYVRHLHRRMHGER
jgi:hypothetical protein